MPINKESTPTFLKIATRACLGAATGLALAAPAIASPSQPTSSAVAAHLKARHRGRTHSRAARHISISCSASAAHPRRRSAALIRDCRRGDAKPHSTSKLKPAPAKVQTLPTVAPSTTSAMIASALSTPCQDTELTPEAGNLEAIRGAVLCLVNRERAQNSEAPLELNRELDEAAENHCEELIADDYFAHISPSGITPVDRVRTAGYIPGPSVGYVIGENLAWGTLSLATPQAIVAAWIASPGHLANILETQYRDTGIAITPAVPASLSGGSPGATYAQEFGVIIH